MKYPHNYIGEQVFSAKAGKTFLGDVKDAYKQTDGSVRLVVNYFNGEPWPFDPSVSDVTILECDEPNQQECRNES